MFGGGLFDFNHDGKMDAMERVLEFEFINRVMEDEEDRFSSLEDILEDDEWVEFGEEDF